MRVYAGIDEAGYGPMFGPFVVARSVFAIEDGFADDAADPPSLWTLLKNGVCKSARDKRKRVAVQDSKKLYTPAAGLTNLERGVLTFASLLGHDPATIEDLLDALGHDDHSRVPDTLWYQRANGHGDGATQSAHDGATDGHATPCAELPAAHDAAQLRIAAAMLRRAVDKTGVSLADLRAAVVYEDRYNHLVATMRSKARCAWKFVSQHLWYIWQHHGQHHPYVVVDRQGGRKVYHDLLQLIWPDAALRLLDESDNISCYRLTQGPRSITISFETDSETNHLPVALASMTAKYTRELLMQRFNDFWLQHHPDTQRTAGYVQDGRRFLAEIDQTIDRLGIDRSVLIRSR
ncbi:MAG: hypothetical protein GC159_01165 [Phycisphaera sp.]|nr:hypothetical protein [Phycisphaera sp.]